MGLLVHLLPDDLRLAKRWALRVGEEEFRKLSLEQAILLGVSSMAYRDFYFELGEDAEKGIFWGGLRLTGDMKGEVRMALRKLFPPSSFALHEGGAWVHLFKLQSLPPSAKEAKGEERFFLSRGLVKVGERVMGKEIPVLSPAKIAELEGLLANL